MAFAVHLVFGAPASFLCQNNFCNCRNRDLHLLRRLYFPFSVSSGTISVFLERNKKWAGRHFRSRVPKGSPHLLSLSWRGSSAVCCSRLNVADVRSADATTGNNRDKNSHNDSQTRTVEIPVTCYQIVGVRDQAEKDEIVKSVMNLRNAEVEEGYTMNAVVSRQNLLMDVRDKLLFEPEYAGNVREKVPPKSSLRVPWTWVAGALCLLQEVGQEKLVLDIGRVVLQHPDAEPYAHDLLLSMALAECAIAAVGFERNNIFEGFEALARAQCLLRSKVSLGQLNLLSQIEESLEELAPACTLELLGMPHAPENAERRLGAIAALRELLRQGLDVEASCQVYDWPWFLGQALAKLMAAEIVNILPWDTLAETRKNKKSLESQNQRVVIDFNCFYMALTAHIALGFSSRQRDLINKAKTICECLMASEGIDLKFVEVFCLFLLGQAEEAEAVERFQQLELNSEIASRSSFSEKDFKDVASVKQSLESWLKDDVLNLFSDTKSCCPSLVSFFSGEKKVSGNGQTRGFQYNMLNTRPSLFSPAPISHRRVSEEPLSHMNSSRHLGLAVKQLASSNVQGMLPGKNNSDTNINMPSIQLKRNLGAHHDKIWKSWLGPDNVISRITFVMVLGCIMFAALKLSALKVRSLTRWTTGKPGITAMSDGWIMDSSLNESSELACLERSSIIYKLKKLFSNFIVRFGNYPDAINLPYSCLAASLSSSVTTPNKRPMPVEEAESLVKQWQAIKAVALGPGHQVHSLYEVLDGPMLAQWQALANTAKTRSCFWRFVLLQLSIMQAEIFSDGIGGEMAQIEVLLEEAAELVDESQLKNPNYYSKYQICYVLKRLEDKSWRFCEADIRTP
ncbi:hypothetical protein NMG60_11031044 [Bertholletia excelsa]